jgi:type IV pilus assembly protein PilN
MIKINLLPIRADDKTNSLKIQAGVGLAVLLIVAGVCFYFYNEINGQVGRVHSQIKRVEDETKRLQGIIGEIEQIKTRKADLEKKLEVIDSLEKDRLNTVMVMEAVALATPEQLWLSSLDFVGGAVKVQGAATDNQIIAIYIQALGQNPEISNIVLTETRRAEEQGFEVVKFTMTFTIKINNEAKNGPSTQRKG